MHRLRIATYNIHKGRGLDGRVRIQRIARVLEEIDADVVALQEVVNQENDSVERHQASYLAEKFGYRFALGETRKHRGAVYGNVTLSRRPFELIKHIDLSVPRREERGALRTDIQVSHRTVHVFNVHLGTAFFERTRQASRLIEGDFLRALDISGPRVVLGDFNEWIRGRVTRTLRAEFHETDLRVHLPRVRSYPVGIPILHLDHIYFDRHIEVERAFFLLSGLSLLASDHLPLVADLKIRDD